MKRGRTSSLLRLGQGNGNGAALTLVPSCGFQGLEVDLCAAPPAHFCVEELKILLQGQSLV